MANKRGELDAMAAIAAELDDLEAEERQRVLAWVGSKYNVALTNGGGKRAAFAKEQPDEMDVDFSDFASFFNSAAPKTENEKVLVAGYWFQKMQGAANLESAALNAALTDLGHSISNITRTFDRLKAEKPALAIQIQKAGKAKQARKKYKITHEGLRFVEKLIRSASDGDEEES